MKQLTGPDGGIVIDCPAGMDDIIQALLATGEASEPFKAGVVKASPAIIGAMQAAVEEARRTPQKGPDDGKAGHDPDSRRELPAVVSH